MAKVIWNKQAETEWRKRLLYEKHHYRHFRLIGPLKLIYYYIESSDTIRIVDVWDSRREPKKLSKRIS